MLGRRFVWETVERSNCGMTLAAESLVSTGADKWLILAEMRMNIRMESIESGSLGVDRMAREGQP